MLIVEKYTFKHTNAVITSTFLGSVETMMKKLPSLSLLISVYCQKFLLFGKWALKLLVVVAGTEDKNHLSELQKKIFNE